MTKNKLVTPADKAGENTVARKMERVGILFNNFTQTISSGPTPAHRTFKSWSRGQIVWKDADIDVLVELGAPIEVFFRYVD